MSNLSIVPLETENVVPMSENKSFKFETRITLGELLVAVGVLGTIVTFLLASQARITKLEVTQQYQGDAIRELKQQTEKLGQTQEYVVRLLEQRTKP